MLIMTCLIVTGGRMIMIPDYEDQLAWAIVISSIFFYAFSMVLKFIVRLYTEQIDSPDGRKPALFLIIVF